MNIYVDFDDCLCETARYFSDLMAKLFGKEVPYEKIHYFDLQKSFSLSKEQYEYMMIEGHRPEALLSYAETPGATETVNRWMDKGYDVSIITGRPFSSFEPSRLWLDQHGLKRAKLYCLNKYGRDSFIKNSDFSLELEDYYKMHFDYAVEDSPTAFKFFDHLPNLKVLVFDRPWNQECEFPTDGYKRCLNWEGINEEIEELDR
jgi:hypothetical protein